MLVLSLHFVNYDLSGRWGLLAFVLFVIYILYSPAHKGRRAKAKYLRIVALWKKNFRKTVWKIHIPYLQRFLKFSSPLTLAVFFVWLGIVRYGYVTENSVFEIKLTQETVRGSVLGQNAVGLVVVVDESFLVLPIEAISSLKVLADQ